MAGISLIDVDLGAAAKTLVPVIAFGGLAFGAWYVWQKTQANAANNAAAQAPGADVTALYQQAEDQALLQSLFPGAATPAQNTSTGTTPNNSTNPAANATTPSPVAGNLNAAPQGSGVG